MEALGQAALTFSQLSMFPFFDCAHYMTSVMALKEQPGAIEVARRSPFACWFSAILNCFGGAILSGLMLAEPPVVILSQSFNILLASATWYLIFYCPGDVFYQCASFLPLRLVIAGMKEVTRPRKILSGIVHANVHYKDAWMVMIAVGWARGAGGGLISNFEQLVRGVWKPESNELLKMSYPVKVTLIGAILFTLQHTHHLPIEKDHLIFLYSIFLIVTKINMILTGSAVSPFAPFEAVVNRTLFGWQQLPPEMKPDINASSNGTNTASNHMSEKGANSCLPPNNAMEQSMDTTKKKQAKKDE